MRSLSPSQRLLLAQLTDRFQNDLMNEPDAHDLLDYLVEGRGITEQSVNRFRLGAVVRHEGFEETVEPIMMGRVAIPYITPTGVVALRYMQPPPRLSGPKYWQPEGTALGIYNTPAIAAGGPRIAIVEGEMDCIILNQIGIPAVGMPGASSWRDHYHAIFDGYTEVVVVGDNDEKEPPKLSDEELAAGKKQRVKAGIAFTKKISEQVPNPRIVMMPSGHDVNSAFLELGADAILDRIKWKKGWA